MGFLKKKNCDVCGEKIGLLGNKKLVDGNICKDCAKKLSHWFSGRRQTTLEEIKDQLEYRKANEAKVANFNVSKRLGRDTMVLIDDNAENFIVSFTGSIENDNPDVINFSDVLDCSLDIEESRTELKQLDNDGNQVSYRIRRYEYHYDFYITILVNNPFFDEIKFKLNSYKVNGQSRHEYDKYKDAGEEICATLNRQKQAGNRQSYAEPIVQTPAFCPNCGSAVNQDNATFCQSCGASLKA